VLRVDDQVRKEKRKRGHGVHEKGDRGRGQMERVTEEVYCRPTKPVVVTLSCLPVVQRSSAVKLTKSVFDIGKNVENYVNFVRCVNNMPRIVGY